MTEPIEITDLFKLRTELKRELARVEERIARWQHYWKYTPDAAFEDRLGDRWVQVTYRTCMLCGLVCERITESPRGGLGEWERTAKFKAEAA
ncbi:hypothetical protein JQ580_33605 [Bradyrhizobium japonicum]|uniref:hypothetical protein n=1 Tax=Bradyrhizobium japonicum TaxID=375 RepID=UPI001BA86804|nr:hypothetical protein [Bradyrhizobium japonicum]MBR0995652.1 hypothetical protein [Bradyrhizobium japonicum]